MGARALVIRDDEVLLVHHTYVEGWSSIGGAVDSNESLEEALRRELKEEVGVTPLEPPKLLSIYYNNSHQRDDFVAFYIIKKFNITDSLSPEIAEKRWFKLNNLPPDIAPGTLRRIEEYLGIREITDRW